MSRDLADELEFLKAEVARLREALAPATSPWPWLTPVQGAVASTLVACYPATAPHERINCAIEATNRSGDDIYVKDVRRVHLHKLRARCRARGFPKTTTFAESDHGVGYRLSAEAFAWLNANKC